MTRGYSPKRIQSNYLKKLRGTWDGRATLVLEGDVLNKRIFGKLLYVARDEIGSVGNDHLRFPGNYLVHEEGTIFLPRGDVRTDIKNREIAIRAELLEVLKVV
jgi:hypothetical protein